MARIKSTGLLGIKDQQRLLQIGVVKDKALNIWARGLVNHPDFTLHGLQHSDAILRTINNLMAKLKGKVVFNDTELFLIGASAYLHDIGMLIDIDGFIEERLRENPDIQVLELEQQRRHILTGFAQDYGEEIYVDEYFNKENPVEPENIRNAALIRELHHLFSDFLITKFKEYFNISEGHEYLYIARISRGHRRSDLNHDEFNTSTLDGEQVRTGVLAALLRIADELDYSSKRIPDIHFEMYEYRLRREPSSLEHWIKHFYITSPGTVTRCISQGPSKLLTPEFEICATVPNQDFKDMIQEHIEKSRSVIHASCVKKRLKEVGITLPKIDDSRIVVSPRVKKIPGSVGSEIKQKGLWDFLRELTGVQVLSNMSKPTVSLLENPPAPEQIARAIGYLRNYCEFTYDISTQEACKVSFIYEIEAQDRLSYVTTEFWNEEPLDSICSCKVYSFNKDYNVKCIPTVQQGGKQRVYGVRITPPLEELGKTLKYAIVEHFSNLLALTREDMERKCGLHLHGVTANMEAVYASIVIPTARLVLRVIFPPQYKVVSGQYMVTMIDSGIRCPEEEKRIKQDNFFRVKRGKTDRRSSIELDISEPRLLRSYVLKWLPVDI